MESPRPPKLLVLTSSYPVPGRCGPVGYLHELACGLAGSWEVSVIAPGGPGLPATECRDGVAIERFGYLYPRRWQRLAYGDGIPDNLRRTPLLGLQIPSFFASWTGRATARARQANVINAHWVVPGGLVGAIASRLTGVPLVVTLHSGDVHLLTRLAGGRALARWITRSAAAIVAPSPYVGEVFAGLLGQNPELRSRLRNVPLGVSVPAEVAALAARPADPAHVLFCGRLIPLKGVDLLIRAVAGMPDVVLDVAGDGAERRALEHLAGTGRVSFHGWVEPGERVRLMERARCVVLPSRIRVSGRTEGLPRVLLEALAAGTPVIASSVGGMAVRNGEPWLGVAPEDAGGLRDALRRVLADQSLAEDLSRRGRELARSREWDRVLPLYGEVLGTAARAVPFG